MPSWTSFITPQFITSIIVILVVIHVLLGAAAYLILLERKVCSWVQDRIGPNRVGFDFGIPVLQKLTKGFGFWGLGQPLADGLKLFFKEDFIPRGADKWLFIIAPVLTVIPALIAFAIIPWAGSLDVSSLPFLSNVHETVKITAADVNIGVIYLVATASLGVYGVALGGWASNSKYSFLGGMRASAQMISYEIPMGLALLCVILTAGTIMPGQLIAAQAGAGHQWFILHQPLAALLFYICMLAEANRAPFDLAEAEAELVGGWHTEYSSMKWALFFLGEYVGMCVSGAFFATLFLGGWSLNPIGLGPDLPTAGVAVGLPIILLQFLVMLGKVFIIVFLTMMVRWTLPRFRFDQLMRLSWEDMIPASLVMLLATSVFVAFGWLHYMWLGSLAVIALICIVYPLMPRKGNPNHRVALIGSRFSPTPESRALTGVSGLSRARATSST